MNEWLLNHISQRMPQWRVFSSDAALASLFGWRDESCHSTLSHAALQWSHWAPEIIQRDTGYITEREETETETERVSACCEWSTATGSHDHSEQINPIQIQPAQSQMWIGEPLENTALTHHTPHTTPHTHYLRGLSIGIMVFYTVQTVFYTFTSPAPKPLFLDKNKLLEAFESVFMNHLHVVTPISY